MLDSTSHPNLIVDPPSDRPAWADLTPYRDRSHLLAVRKTIVLEGWVRHLEAPREIPFPDALGVWNAPSPIEQTWRTPGLHIHGTVVGGYEQAALFGANTLIGPDLGWLTESVHLGEQYLDAYLRPGFPHLFPGAKPVVARHRDLRVADFRHLSDHDWRFVEEPVFLATPAEPDNFGRWVSTMVGKVAYWRKWERDRAFFCRTRHPWQRMILKWLGVPDAQIVDHDPGATYLLRDVRTIRHTSANQTISADERATMLELAQRTLSLSDQPPESKIFVSRKTVSRSVQSYRVLMNEAALCDAMAQRGFRVIEPEQYPIYEQVRLFAGAKLVVGLGGAAIYNTVFCAPDARVLTIESSNAFTRPHTRLLGSLGLGYGVFYGDLDPYDPAPHHKRWTVDIPAVLRAVDQLG